MSSPRDVLDERFDRAPSTSTCGSRTTCRTGARAPRRPRRGRSTDDGLHLTIPADQPLWCPDLHPDPLRVSCIQSGSFAGPLGSTIGQQPFQDGLVGPRGAAGDVGLHAAATGGSRCACAASSPPRSMFAFWMSGIEDRPERCGEICVAEMFGDAIRDGSADVGMGMHRVPRSRAGARSSAPSRWRSTSPSSTRTASSGGRDRWRSTSTATSVRRLDQAPDYPVQLMIGVFDFPTPLEDGDPPVPEMVVSHVRGEPLGWHENRAAARFGDGGEGRVRGRTAAWPRPRARRGSRGG